MRIILTISLAVMAVLVLGGCKKNSPVGPVAADFKAFDSATPEVKQVWQAALDADHTNDFAKGLTLYYSLLGGNLTPEQQESVKRLSTGLNQRLMDAVQKGDAAAQAGLQELRQGARNRGR
jgi:hypothetical protein